MNLPKTTKAPAPQGEIYVSGDFPVVGRAIFSMSQNH